MNNRGFAVSTILYTILICFMLFLGAAMAMFSASNSLSSSANDELINGTELSATSVTSEEDTNIKIKISSKYGIVYWPRDFENTSTPYKNIKANSISPNSDVSFKDTISGDTKDCTYDRGNDSYNCN